MDFLVDFNTAVVEVCRRMQLNPLKPKQLEALSTFISGKDTFVALPTGYGKSIIFAIMPLLFDIMLGKVVYVKQEKIFNFYTCVVYHCSVQSIVTYC